MKYRIELVWNREFHWVHWADRDNLGIARLEADSMVNSGDGMRVKKIRVIENATDKIVYSK